MKKLLITLFALLCITATTALAATTAEFTIDSPVLNIQTTSITTSALDAAPYIKNGRTMIPIYALNTAFGADVVWNGEDRTVDIIANGKQVKLTIDSDIITLNGAEVKIDCPAEITNDRTFLPLRAVSENLGYYVYYVHATHQIIVEDTIPVMTVNGHDVPYCMFKMLYENNKTDNEETNSLLVSNLYLYFQEIDSIYKHAVEAGYDLTDEEYDYVNNMVKKNPLNNILASAMAKDATEYYIVDKYLADMNDNLDIDYAEAEAFYKKNYVRAKHILIMANDKRSEKEALALANSVYKKASSGTNFDSLIEKYGEDPGMAINTNGYTFTYGEMISEFEDACFEMQEGTVSEPVKTAWGYHIIQRLPLQYDEKIINDIIPSVALSKTADFATYLKDSAIIIKNIDEENLEKLIK